jgi:hypothetical protein
MTKVQTQFRLSGPLNDAMLARIADAHSIYGIARVKLGPASDALSVEYDATRLRPAEVESALAAAGIPVTRVALP